MQFVGGIIAYFALRQDDPPKAKNCLFLGVILTGISVAMTMLPIILLFSASAWVPYESIQIPPSNGFETENANLEV